MTGPDTKDYQPRAWPPGWQPRHMRGEYSVPMDSPRRGPEAMPRTILDDAICVRVPPGASMRDATNGRDHRWNNQHGEQLVASLARAAEQSRRSKAAAKLLRPPTPPKPARESKPGALAAKIIAWLVQRGAPANRHQIATGLGIAHDATRTPVNRLLRLGLIKTRHYSLAGEPGHKAQYLASADPWPAWPAGARPITRPAPAPPRGAPRHDRHLHPRAHR